MRWDPDTRGKWWRRTRRVSITVRGVNKVPAPPPSPSTPDSGQDQQNPPKGTTFPKKTTSPSTTTSTPSYEEVTRRNSKPQTLAQTPDERQGLRADKTDPRAQPGKRNTRKEGNTKVGQTSSTTPYPPRQDIREGGQKEEGQTGSPPPHRKVREPRERSRESPRCKGKGTEAEEHTWHSTHL